METRSEIENRLYVFPNSALKIDNKKINYYNFLTKTQDIDCIRALQYVTEHISMDKIKKVIRNIPMTDIQQQFYLTMLIERKEHIIEKAYQLQKERGYIVTEEPKKTPKKKKSTNRKYVPRI